MEKREFYVLIERDNNGGFVGEAAQFSSCRSQGKTLDELMDNMRKAIRSCLENGDQDRLSEIVGIYKIEV